MPTLERILETALYVDDLDRAAAFYHDVLGLRILDAGPRLVAMTPGRPASSCSSNAAPHSPERISERKAGFRRTTAAARCTSRSPPGPRSCPAGAPSEGAWHRDRKQDALGARRHQPLLPRSGRPLGRDRDARSLGHLLKISSRWPSARRRSSGSAGPARRSAARCRRPCGRRRRSAPRARRRWSCRCGGRCCGRG